MLYHAPLAICDTVWFCASTFVYKSSVKRRSTGLQNALYRTFGRESYRPGFSTNRLVVHFVPRASATVAVLGA